MALGDEDRRQRRLQNASGFMTYLTEAARADKSRSQGFRLLTKRNCRRTFLLVILSKAEKSSNNDTAKKSQVAVQSANMFNNLRNKTGEDVMQTLLD
jgi:hypothetical protein